MTPCSEPCPAGTRSTDRQSCVAIDPYTHIDLCNIQCTACSRYCSTCGGCIECHTTTTPPSDPVYKRDTLQTMVNRMDTCGTSSIALHPMVIHAYRERQRLLQIGTVIPARTQDRVAHAAYCLGETSLDRTWCEENTLSLFDPG